MDQVILDADVIGSINYLYKHLFDNPIDNPTNVPKVSPIGTEITEIKEVSALLGVDNKVASVYVLQDPMASVELKQQAQEVLNPGIFVPSEDAYLPVMHKAFEIATNPAYVEEKRIRMVRTVAGVRRFRQKAGSIIVTDGEAPLDALVALRNDVPGYEKVGGKNGGVFYVGKEKGKWVARDPLNGTVLHEGTTEEETYKWLNKYAGGNDHSSTNGKEPATAASRVLGRTQNSRTRQVDEVEASRDAKLTTAQAHEVNRLNNEQLDLYQRLRERGIDYDTAIIIAKHLAPKRKSSTTKKKA